jgi:hypothetical protein
MFDILSNQIYVKFAKPYKSISKRLSISLLNVRNRDFGEKLYLNGHSNVTIIYSGFFASYKSNIFF